MVLYVILLFTTIISLILQKIFYPRFNFINDDGKISIVIARNLLRLFNFINIILMIMAATLIYFKKDNSLFLIQKPDFNTETFGIFSYFFLFIFIVNIIYSLIIFAMAFIVNKIPDKDFIHSFILKFDDNKNKKKKVEDVKEEIENLKKIKTNLSKYSEKEFYKMVKSYEINTVFYNITSHLLIIISVYSFLSYILYGKNAWLIFFVILFIGLLFNSKDKNGGLNINLSIMFIIFSFDSILIAIIYLLLNLLLTINYTPMLYRVVELKDDAIKEIDLILANLDNNDVNTNTNTNINTNITSSLNKESNKQTVKTEMSEEEFDELHKKLDNYLSIIKKNKKNEKK